MPFAAQKSLPVRNLTTLYQSVSVKALTIGVAAATFAAPTAVQAQQTVPGQSANCEIINGEAICEGDLEGGISSQIDDPDFAKLIVQNANGPIAPDGIFGIGVSRSTGDIDVEVANGIVINTFDDPSVPEPAQGIILITGAGNISLLSGATVTTDGNGQSAAAVELAITAGDGDVTLTNNGDVSVTTSAQFSNALLARQLGGTGNVTVVNDGNLSATSTSSGERDTALAGILATSQLGGGAIAVTNSGDITVTASKDNTDSNFDGIASGIVTNAFGEASDTDIINTGEITLVGSEVFGITAASFNTIGAGTATIDIDNSGAITGTEIGGRGILGQGFGNAVDINVMNDGDISLGGDFNFGIFVTGSAFQAADAAASVFNLGVVNEGDIDLAGNVENGIFVQNQGASGDISVTNTGIITQTGNTLRGIGLSSFGGIENGNYTYNLTNNGNITLTGDQAFGITVFGTFDDEVVADLTNNADINLTSSTTATSAGIQVRFDADSAIDANATGTASTADVTLANNGDITLGAGTGIDILGGDITALTNTGAIAGSGDGGIGVSIRTYDTANFSNEDADITAQAFGVVLTGNDGSEATLANTGTLQAAAAAGVGVFVANGNLAGTNDGTIIGGNIGIAATGGTVSSFRNNGTITGSAGTAISSEADVAIQNFGTVTGANTAIFSRDGSIFLANNGAIEATSGVGLQANDRIEFANAGSLTAAGGVAIQVTGTGGGDSSIVTGGGDGINITGDIILSDGNDSISAAADGGLIDGNIDTGAGDDSVLFDNDAVSGTVNLGTGNDIIGIALDDDLVVDGGADDDTLLVFLDTGTDRDADLGVFNFTSVETFEQIGTGTLRVTGDGTVFENYLLRGGRVLVDGNVAATDFAVLAGTTIGGTGTIGSLNVTGGTLAPGNAGSGPASVPVSATQPIAMVAHADPLPLPPQLSGQALASAQAGSPVAAGNTTGTGVTTTLSAATSGMITGGENVAQNGLAPSGMIAGGEHAPQIAGGTSMIIGGENASHMEMIAGGENAPQVTGISDMMIAGGDNTAFDLNMLLGGENLAFADDLSDALIAGGINTRFAGAMINGGENAPFAAGQNIGTLTINGTLAMDSDSFFEVEVDDQGNSDRVIVIGSVSLGEATLTVLDMLGGDFMGADPFNYIIIDNDAMDAVNGVFGTITNQLAFLTPTVTYNAGDGNDVQLALTRNNTPPPPPPTPTPVPTPTPTPVPTPTPTPVPPPVVVVPPTAPLFPTVARTFNQTNAANGLDDFDQTAGTDANTVYMNVLLTTVPQALQAFDTSSGEIYASLLADGLSSGMARADKLAARAHEPGKAGWGIWGGVTGGSGNVDSDGNAASVDSDSLGFDMGLDYRGADDAWALGISWGYINGDLEVSQRFSRADYDGWHLGAYGRYGDNGQGLTVSAAISYSDIEADVTRGIRVNRLSRIAAGNVGVEVFTIAGDLRYGFDVGQGWSAGPMVSIHHGDADLGRFNETGANSLNLTGGGSSDDFTRYGGGLFANWQGTDGGIDASLQYIGGKDSLSELGVSLAGAPNANFRVRSPNINGSAAAYSVAGRYELGGGWSIGGNIRGLIGGDEKSVVGSAIVGWKF